LPRIKPWHAHPFGGRKARNDFILRDWPIFGRESERRYCGGLQERATIHGDGETVPLLRS